MVITLPIILNSLLLLSTVVAFVILWRIHLSKHEGYKDFTVVDLITAKNGKISRPAFMELGAFLIMSWGFVVLINRNALNEWYVTVYLGAFVLRSAYSSWLQSKQPTSPTENKP